MSVAQEPEGNYIRHGSQAALSRFGGGFRYVFRPPDGCVGWSNSKATSRPSRPLRVILFDMPHSAGRQATSRSALAYTPISATRYG